MSQTLNNERLVATAQWLAESDGGFASILKTCGPPPLWAREPGFATLVRIILEQQVSLASADAMYRRLTEKLGPLTPAGVLGVGGAGLRALGVTRQKSAYFINISAAVVRGDLVLEALDKQEDSLVFGQLTAIKGIGPWTAGIYLLMALLRPDAWPPGDVALATAYKDLQGLRQRPAPAELDRVAENWRPHRATAARLLWHYYLSRKTHRDQAT